MWTKTQHPMLFCVMSREHLHFSCPGKEVRLSWERRARSWHMSFSLCLSYMFWLACECAHFPDFHDLRNLFSSLFFKLNFLFCSDFHLLFRSLIFGCCSVYCKSLSKIELWSLFKSPNSYWGFVSLDPSWCLSSLLCCNPLSHLQSVTKAPW